MLRLCSTLGGITAPWKSVVKLSASPGLPPVPFPPLGKVLGVSVGRGWDGTCARAARTCGPWKRRRAFFIMLPWCLGGTCILTALMAHSYLFTLKFQLQRKNSLFIFPLLMHFKKRKRLYSGNLLWGYCQSKYLASSVLIKRQQMEVSLSTGTILRAVGIGAWKGGIMLTKQSRSINPRFAPVRSKPTYRLPSNT